MGLLKTKRPENKRISRIIFNFATKFMRHFPGILILFVVLFTALPVSGVLACGHGDAMEKDVSPEKVCCSKDASPEEKTPCEEETHACDQNHPGEKCPDQGGCCGKGCTCPCGAIPGGHTVVVLAELPVALAATSDATLKQAFYFAQHMPEEVYLPIWQPPKLNA